MKQPFYIIHPCRLRRKDNTIHIDWKWNTEKPFISPASVIGEELRSEFPYSEEDSWWFRVPKFIPLHRVDSIHILAPVDMNSDLIALCFTNQVSIHYYDWSGEYMGSLHSAQGSQNGILLKKQVLLSNTSKKKLLIASTILESSFKNIKRLLLYYNRRNSDVDFDTSFIDNALIRLKSCTSISGLMGVEGGLRRKYYEAIDLILPETMCLSGRSFRPALNPANALLSYLNALLYAVIEMELLHTPLHLSLGLLHTEGLNKTPLVYDISELFKPVLVDPVFLTLIRKKMIDSKDFDETETGFRLKKDAQLKVLRAFSGKVHTTVFDEHLKRHVSYRTRIRLEGYKLVNFLLKNQTYEPYTHKW
jgi:CRISPR-associated protein Cas1